MNKPRAGDPLDAINKNLEVIIALLLRRTAPPDDAPTARQQIATLESLGVRPKDVARILGKTESYVNKELATIRKGRATKGTK